MKSIVKISSLALGVLLLIGCKTETQESEQNQDTFVVGGVYVEYDFLTATANTHAQIGDIFCNFDILDITYGSYEPTFNNNFLYISLSDTTQPYSVTFVLFTEVMESDAFFRKGTWKIDTMEIGHCNINIPLSYTSNHFGNVSVIFSWDYVVYEKKLLFGSLDEYTEGKCLIHGKGVLEIKDTIFTDFPEIYYPPQKIVFEF